MDLALAELIAAWNCVLQSEKSMRAAGSVADGLAEAEPLAEPAELAEPAVLVTGGAARLGDVQAAPASSATPATSTDRRVRRRVGCTC